MKGPVKLRYPLPLTYTVAKLAPPKRIGNGGLITAEESSLRLRLLPPIVLQTRAVGE